MKIILASMLIWLGVIPIAFINGCLREIILLPKLGNTIGYAISGVLLIISIFLLSFFFIPKLGSGTRINYIVMGIVWLVCTVVFEFIVGFLRKQSLRDILQSYNIFTGNLWLLVLIFIGFAPYIIATIRKLY